MSRSEGARMRRREFITLLGSAAFWRDQRRNMVVGFMTSPFRVDSAPSHRRHDAVVKRIFASTNVTPSQCPCAGVLHRPYPAPRQAGRSSGTGADQVRNRCQSHDSEGARRNDTARPAFGRRQGNRITRNVRFGPKQTCRKTQLMSLLGGKRT